MKVVNTISQVRKIIKEKKMQGMRIGYLVTTGHLHDAHVYLLTVLEKHCDYIVVSNMNTESLIRSREYFYEVNPSTESDIQVLKNSPCNLLFTPTLAEIYPYVASKQTHVVVPEVTEGLCNTGGREGFFRAVATCILKLMNIVTPDVTVFGEKDYQQAMVAKKMIRDLNLPIDVITAPVMRHENGLAYASRNAVLNEKELSVANKVFEAMDMIKGRLLSGDKDFDKMEADANDFLLSYGFTPDFIKMREPETLARAHYDSTDLILFASAYLGADRIVDTMPVNNIPKAIYNENY